MIKKDEFIKYKLESLGRAPREQLVEFLKIHQQEVANGKIKTALDLGCGGCIETCLLASQGLKVTALDAVVPNQIKQACKDALSPEDLSNIRFEEQNFQNLVLPKADLVWSFAAMSFCPKESFGQMLAKSIMAVNPNGYFAAHFFDKTHPFITIHGNTGVTQEQVQQIFDYVGFKADVNTFKTERTQNGQYTQNLNNVYVVAKAPEQLKDLPQDQLTNKINEILDLQQDQEINSQQQDLESNNNNQTQPTSVLDKISTLTQKASLAIKTKLGLNQQHNYEDTQNNPSSIPTTPNETEAPVLPATQTTQPTLDISPTDFTQ